MMETIEDRLMWLVTVCSVRITDAGRLDENRAVGQINPCGDVESVKIVLHRTIDNSLRHQIHGGIGSGVGIDDRGSDDAFLIKTSGSAARKILATGRGATIQHTGVPQDRKSTR